MTMYNNIMVCDMYGGEYKFELYYKTMDMILSHNVTALFDVCTKNYTQHVTLSYVLYH